MVGSDLGMRFLLSRAMLWLATTAVMPGLKSCAPACVVAQGLSPAAMHAQAPAARPPAADLAAALQQKYDAIRDFSADFMHTYEGGVLRKRVSERGTLLIKKPGKMRWTYTSPEEKVFVSDGVKLYSHIPRDRQVIVSSVPQEDEASTPALFLTGKGNLLRDFTAAYTDVEGAPAGTSALAFTPREPQREYEWLTLVFNRGTLTLRMLATADRQGGQSTFTFTNLKENAGLSDNVFAFTIPRGTDVITETPVSR